MNSALTPRRLAERCEIVLLAADGKTNEEIAAVCSITRQKAGRRRDRFVQGGRKGIEEDPRARGRKFLYGDEIREDIVRKTTNAKPPSATHWSRRSMAKAAGVSDSTVGRISSSFYSAERIMVEYRRALFP